jgi:hypothetical protein
MNTQTPQTGPDEGHPLGEPVLVCRINRKVLFWGFLLASLSCGLGALLLFFMIRMLAGDWVRDLSGLVTLLVVGVLLLWGGRVLWRRTNRLRPVRAVVHAGGLSYCDHSGCLTCRWDEIEDVQWKILSQYEKTSIAIGGLVPIPGTTIQRLSHTSHQIVVRRKDGVLLVFTSELQDIVGLALAIQEGRSRTVRGG